MEQTMSNGITVKEGKGASRVELECEHQSGLLYVIPGEASWVCSDSFRPAHAIAGFLKELESLSIPQVREIMNRWGIYYRERPLKGSEQS